MPPRVHVSRLPLRGARSRSGPRLKANAARSTVWGVPVDARKSARDALSATLRRGGHLTIGVFEQLGVGDQKVIELLENRARSRGAPEVLLGRGRRLAGTVPLVSTVAFYRLLRKVGAGGLASIAPLLRKFAPEPPTEAEMWAVISLAGFDVAGLRLAGDRVELQERLSGPIDAELDATNASVIFEWLVGNDVYDLGDDHLQRHVERRLALVVQRRYDADAPPRSDALRDSRRETIRRLHQATPKPVQPVFLAGATLLDAVTGRSDDKSHTLEFGTFGDLEGLGARLSGAGFAIEHLSAGRLHCRDARTGISADVHRYEVVGELVVDRDAWYTRWYSYFEPRLDTFDQVRCFVPDDVDRYLDERFGNWTTPTLFYDDVFDSPNTTINHSADAMFALYRRSRHAFENGQRHIADETARRLRDLFDVDVTMYVPQPVHRKVLWRPPERARAGDRRVVVAGAYASIDANSIRRLTNCAAGRSLIAAVHGASGNKDATEGMATAKTLKVVDHVVMYESIEELASHLDDLGVEDLLLDQGAAVTSQEIGGLGLTVTVSDIDQFGNGDP